MKTVASEECKALSECQAFVQSLENVPSDLHSEMIDAFVLYLQVEYPEVMQVSLKDEYVPEDVKVFVTDSNIDALDLTGLEGRQAQNLALLLTRWNGSGRAYRWRNGKRYLNSSIKTLQVNHPLVIDLGIESILEFIPQSSFRYEGV
jgi:hypothetical protein